MVVDEHWPDVPVYAGIAAEFPGSEVRCYVDYGRALAACKQNTPDILVMDADVWKTDAVAFVRRLRSHAGWTKLMIVQLGSTTGKSAEYARTYGADVFIKKPIQAESFMRFLHGVLDLRAARAGVVRERSGFAIAG